MSFSRVHVIGAGMAGLSAASVLAEAGISVSLHEAGPAAGGRARSYFDQILGCRVDNGNHLLLSGNRAVMAYLARINARHTLVSAEEPAFPFIDLPSGERWVVRPNRGLLPWWILVPRRRVPTTKARDYLSLNTLRKLSDDSTVGAILSPGPLAHRLLEPLAIAALNTPPDVALARLLGAVVNETLAAGGAACIPCVPREGLSESLVDPALDWLATNGADITFANRVASLEIAGDHATAIHATQGRIVVGPSDAIVLATPPWIAAALLPGLTVPDAYQAIVNVHFRADIPVTPPGFIGLIGGVAEWVFVKPQHVSVTISAANHIVDDSAESIASATWPDVRRALNLPPPMPNWRVVKERRATFAATAAQERRRPMAQTNLRNVALAGDWTATGLPATIEGAIRSGNTAAELLLRGT